MATKSMSSKGQIKVGFTRSQIKSEKPKRKWVQDKVKGHMRHIKKEVGIRQSQRVNQIRKIQDEKSVR